MISEVGKWMDRVHGDVTFHLSQVLTGHCAFNYYLKRLNIVGSDTCAQSGVTPDDAEHAICICDAWHSWIGDAYGDIEVQELMSDNFIEQ